MSIGCNIYFKPTDSTWTAGPELIRGVAAWLKVDTFEFLRVYREAPSSSEIHPPPETKSEILHEERAVSVEAAISLQQVDHQHTTVMNFSGAIKERLRDVQTTLPPSLSEGFVPKEGSFYNGHWKHYDYSSGKLASESACCLILGNDAGYPVELGSYLEAFLQVPSVSALRRHLEELSGQPWRATIDLT